MVAVAVAGDRHHVLLLAEGRSVVSLLDAVAAGNRLKLKNRSRSQDNGAVGSALVEHGIE